MGFDVCPGGVLGCGKEVEDVFVSVGESGDFGGFHSGEFSCFVLDFLDCLLGACFLVSASGAEKG